MMSPSKKRRGWAASSEVSDPELSLLGSSVAREEGGGDLLRSIQWHLSELMRLAELLEGKNLCKKDLVQQLSAISSGGR